MLTLPILGVIDCTYKCIKHHIQWTWNHIILYSVTTNNHNELIFHWVNAFRSWDVDKENTTWVKNWPQSLYNYCINKILKIFTKKRANVRDVIRNLTLVDAMHAPNSIFLSPFKSQMLFCLTIDSCRVRTLDKL